MSLTSRHLALISPAFPIQADFHCKQSQAFLTIILKGRNTLLSLSYKYSTEKELTWQTEKQLQFGKEI